MPIKWTAEIDHTLLLKILEVHDIRVDAKSIVERWPADLEKPTPRAISERLVKLRSMVKQSGGGDGHFKISVKQVKSAASSPKTPKTPTSAIRKNNPSAIGSASARKKAAATLVKEEAVIDSTEIKEEDDEEAGADANAHATTLTPAPHAEFPTSMLTPSDTTEGAAMSGGMDGSFETPTPTRRMATRGIRVPVYKTDSDSDHDDSDTSNFHDAASSSVGSVHDWEGGDDEEGEDELQKGI